VTEQVKKCKKEVGAGANKTEEEGEEKRKDKHAK